MVVAAPFCDYWKNLNHILKMGQFLWHVNGISINLFKKKNRGREEKPHVQGAAAAQAQEGREELLHLQGQERRQ